MPDAYEFFTVNTCHKYEEGVKLEHHKGHTDFVCSVTVYNGAEIQEICVHCFIEVAVGRPHPKKSVFWQAMFR